MNSNALYRAPSGVSRARPIRILCGISRQDVRDHDNYARLKSPPQADELGSTTSCTVAGRVFAWDPAISLHRCRYTIRPYHDINGANLLYFATYPQIHDECERDFVAARLGAESQKKDWVRRCSTIAREIYYFGNAAIEDGIVFDLHTSAAIDSTTLSFVSTLRRESDGQRIATVLTTKIVDGRARSILGELLPSRYGNVSSISRAPKNALEITRRCLHLALGVDDAEVREDRDLRDYGLESLTTVEFCDYLATEFGITLDPTRVYEVATVGELVALIDRVGEKSLPARSPSHSLVEPIGCDDIAIVGIGVHLPGASSPDEAWGVFASPVAHCFRELPEDRRALELPLSFGTDPVSLPAAAYLESIAHFDHKLFGVTRREAEVMDPQQRILLETVWRALEDAGQDPSAWRRRNVGVFVGACHADYGELLNRSDRGIDAFAATGTPLGILASRISFHFDFQGPSLTVDTACSSSLVALDIAMAAIRDGRAESAICAGVNVICNHRRTKIYGLAGMLSPRAQCDAFGAGADGYVRGEGALVLVLKPLPAAMAAGDRIYALVRGSAVNHGGRVTSISVPNPKAQAAVISRAFRAAGVSPSSIGLVEAHGTGTPLGDPIEINGLRLAFEELGWRHTDGPKAVLGSVKRKVGHLEGAAGLAGVVKAALALHARVLPPSPAPSSLNAKIDLTETPFRLAAHAAPWPSAEDAPRRAAVSSFGIGGVNAHVILEEGPAVPSRMASSSVAARTVVLSAPTEERLVDAARRLAGSLADVGTDVTLERIAYTLQVGRQPFPFRLAFEATSVDEARAILDGFASAPRSNSVVTCGRAEGGASASSDASLSVRWVAGEAVRWQEHYPQPPCKIALPGYAFDRHRHWIGGLLGEFYRVVSATIEARSAMFIVELILSDPVIEDHVVKGAKVLPGVAHLELVRALAERWRGSSIRGLRNVVWLRPIVAESERRRVEIVFRSAADTVRFELSTTDGASSRLHSAGELMGDDFGTPDPKAVLRPAAVRDTSSFYSDLARRGLVLGQSYRVIRELSAGDASSVSAAARIFAGSPTSGTYALRPQLLDGALQTCFSLIEHAPPGLLQVPTAVGSVVFHTLPIGGELHVRSTRLADGQQGNARVTRFDIDVRDANHGPLLTLRDVVFRQFTSNERTEGPAVAPRPAAGRRAMLPRIQRPSWKVSPPPPADDTRARAALLAFVPDGQPALMSELERRLPGRVLFALPGDRFVSHAPNRFRVDPSATEHHERLMSALADRAVQLGAVVHAMAAFDEKDDAEARLERGGFAFARVVRSLVGHLRPLRIVFTHRRTGMFPMPEHAAIGAFCRALAKESPRLAFSVVDIDHRAAARDLAPVIEREAFALERSVAEISYVDGRRWARSLESWTLPDGAPDGAFRRAGSYLITGGAGGIGRKVASYLARRYSARVVLIGRSPEEDAIRELLASLLEHGASHAEYVRCDLGAADSVREVVAQVRARLGGIHGVFHCAGVIRDGLFERKTDSQLRSVLVPKVQGTLNLEAATRFGELEHFVLFSSITGQLGNRGQTDYAWGNGFLDSFAIDRNRRRHRSGGPRVLSIAWPYWNDGGMRLSQPLLERMQRELSMRPIEGDLAFDLIERGLASDASSFVVS